MSSTTKRRVPEEDGSDAEITKKAKVTSSQSTEQIFPLGGMKKVTISIFKGQPIVNIREFYKDKNTGEEKPGSKGIALNRAQWEAFVEAMPDILKSFEEVSK